MNRLMVWWLVAARAVLGTIFIVVAMQMVLWARDELMIRRVKGQNGMENEILIGQIRFGWLVVARLSLLTVSAWLSWPYVYRIGTMRWPQVVAAVMVFSLTMMDVTGLVWKWRERDRLMAMARQYRLKTQSEGRTKLTEDDL